MVIIISFTYILFPDIHPYFVDGFTDKYGYIGDMNITTLHANNNQLTARIPFLLSTVILKMKWYDTNLLSRNCNYFSKKYLFLSQQTSLCLFL